MAYPSVNLCVRLVRKHSKHFGWMPSSQHQSLRQI